MEEVKKSQLPVSTKNSGYEIIIPAKQKLGQPAVYKIFFGSKYLIWKGKSLQQSCEIMAKSLSAGISKINRGIPLQDTDYLFHVLKHIKSTRCQHAKVEVMDDDFVEDGVIDGLRVLKLEQYLLDEADGDPLCLNNNVQAYVPDNNVWITQPMKNKFLKWYKERRKK